MLKASTSFSELIFPVSTTRSYINFKRLQHNLRWLSDKSAGQCRRHRRCRFDPWGGKIPWRRKWQPTPVFLPGESHGQKNPMGYSPWGCKELDTTEWLSTHAQHNHSCRNHVFTRQCIFKIFTFSRDVKFDQFLQKSNDPLKVFSIFVNLFWVDCFCYLFLQLLLNSHADPWGQRLYLSLTNISLTHNPRHIGQYILGLANITICICWMDVFFPHWFETTLKIIFETVIHCWSWRWLSKNTPHCLQGK